MKWISIEQLANEFGLSKRTLQNRLSNGSAMPPSYKIGKRRMFRRDEVDAWIASTRVETSIRTQGGRR